MLEADINRCYHFVKGLSVKPHAAFKGGPTSSNGRKIPPAKTVKVTKHAWDITIAKLVSLLPRREGGRTRARRGKMSTFMFRTQSEVVVLIYFYLYLLSIDRNRLAPSSPSAGSDLQCARLRFNVQRSRRYSW